MVGGKSAVGFLNRAACAGWSAEATIGVNLPFPVCVFCLPSRGTAGAGTGLKKTSGCISKEEDGSSRGWTEQAEGRHS